MSYSPRAAPSAPVGICFADGSVPSKLRQCLGQNRLVLKVWSNFNQMFMNTRKGCWQSGWQWLTGWQSMEKYEKHSCARTFRFLDLRVRSLFFSWVAIVLQLKLLNHNGWWPEQGNLHEITISWTWNRQRLRSLQSPILLVGSFWIICPSVPVFVTKLWSW